MNARNRSVLRPATALAALVALAGLVLAPAGTAGADPDPANPGAAPTSRTDPLKIYVAQGADAFAELTNNAAQQYNATVASDAPIIASYDAVNPQTAAVGETIHPKPGCDVARINGANGGITAIKQNLKSTVDTNAYCLDFVRASRAKISPADDALTFYAQSRDAVGYATVGNSYAPTTPLTKEQLKDIFECSTTDWSQVGGQKGAIHVYVQPDSAATYTFFLSAIGSSLGSVSTGCGADGKTLSQQNDGRTLNGDPQGIAPYAVTKWAAQGNGAPGIADLRGGAVPGLIRPAAVTTEPGGGWPTPTTSRTLSGHDYQVLNPAFTTLNPSFGRVFWNAVRNTAPDDLKAIFKSDGYICTHQEELLVPFGNQPLGSDLSASEYCGLAQ